MDIRIKLSTGDKNVEFVCHDTDAAQASGNVGPNLKRFLKALAAFGAGLHSSCEDAHKVEVDTAVQGLASTTAESIASSANAVLIEGTQQSSGAGANT